MMNTQLKQRLVGAAVLTSLAVIFLPMVLDESGYPVNEITPQVSSLPKAMTTTKNHTGDDSQLQTSATGVPIAVKATQPKSSNSRAENTGKSAKHGDAKTTKESDTIKLIDKSRAELSSWIIQVGSFAREQNARELTVKLRGHGFTTHMVKRKGPDGKVFRVQIGPELAYKKIVEVKKALLKKARIKGIILQYPRSK